VFRPISETHPMVEGGGLLNLPALFVLTSIDVYSRT
jgi:hypothetical protein